MTSIPQSPVVPIGVDMIGRRADSLADSNMLRLENLDTDLRPPLAAIESWAPFWTPED